MGSGFAFAYRLIGSPARASLPCTRSHRPVPLLWRELPLLNAGSRHTRLRDVARARGCLGCGWDALHYSRPFRRDPGGSLRPRDPPSSCPSTWPARSALRRASRCLGEIRGGPSALRTRAGPARPWGCAWVGMSKLLAPAQIAHRHVRSWAARLRPVCRIPLACPVRVSRFPSSAPGYVTLYRSRSGAMFDVGPAMSILISPPSCFGVCLLASRASLERPIRPRTRPSLKPRVLTPD